MCDTLYIYRRIPAEARMHVALLHTRTHDLVESTITRFPLQIQTISLAQAKPRGVGLPFPSVNARIL